MFIVIGLIFRVWAIRQLGNHFTATVQILDGHQLITSGPYQLIRHPSYLGAFMAFVGIGLLLNAFWGGIVSGTAMSTAYYFRIIAEEKTLIQYFGSDYLKYKEQTKMLIPCVW